MNLADTFMLGITLGIAGLFIYSTFSPRWLSAHWTPARLLLDSRGQKAVRVFFCLVAVSALVLAWVQWSRMQKLDLPTTAIYLDGSALNEINHEL